MNTDLMQNIEDNQKNIKDYFNLILNNKILITIVTLLCFVIAIIYASNKIDIYSSHTVLKLSKPQNSVLSGGFLQGLNNFANDRFIANEMEVLKSYTIIKKVAKNLIEKYNKNKKASNFYYILNDSLRVKSEDQIALSLPSIVTINQKRGLDVITISVESHSPFEAQLIANLYAESYKSFNLDLNRTQLTVVKNFLKNQVNEKLNILNIAEQELKDYQEKGGIVSLDNQSNALITQISSLEAEKNSTKIQIITSNKTLEKLKIKLEKESPETSAYIENLGSQSYISNLQKEKAKIEIQRDLALSGSKNKSYSTILANYNRKIKNLKEKINSKINSIKQNILLTSPAELKKLSQKIFEEQIKNQALQKSLNELLKILVEYELKFKKLPSSAIAFAKFQRQRESSQKLYLLLEEKYQEAWISEQSVPGNVSVIDKARLPLGPSKPNRSIIRITGFILGLVLSMGFVFVRDYLDNSIKTPEDIENQKINVLTWIPPIEGLEDKKNKDYEFIISKKPDASASEAFRALRTRIMFSKISTNSLQTILVTSSVPQEGKTTVSVNIAGAFANSDKKTLILDADLRKPRLHSVFKQNKYPGFTDYFFKGASYEDVLRTTEVKNLYFIPSGTIPPNPAEIVSSDKMKNFLAELKNKFDIIIIDSPPIIAVTDSEILSTMVDATILVALTDNTEKDLLRKSVEVIKNNSSSFIGAVLNNFSFRSGYGSYYKYYYYYSQSTNGKGSKKSNKLEKLS